MTRLCVLCLSALFLVSAALSPASAYTVMHYKTTTWSLADKDALAAARASAPAEMVNPLSGYTNPGVPQSAPAMGQRAMPYPQATPYCGQPPCPPPYRQTPPYSQPESNLWH